MAVLATESGVAAGEAAKQAAAEAVVAFPLTMNSMKLKSSQSLTIAMKTSRSRSKSTKTSPTQETKSSAPEAGTGEPP